MSASLIRIEMDEPGMAAGMAAGMEERPSQHGRIGEPIHAAQGPFRSITLPGTGFPPSFTPQRQSSQRLPLLGPGRFTRRPGRFFERLLPVGYRRSDAARGGARAGAITPGRTVRAPKTEGWLDRFRSPGTLRTSSELNFADPLDRCWTGP